MHCCTTLKLHDVHNCQMWYDKHTFSMNISTIQISGYEFLVPWYVPVPQGSVGRFCPELIGFDRIQANHIVSKDSKVIFTTHASCKAMCMIKQVVQRNDLQLIDHAVCNRWFMNHKTTTAGFTRLVMWQTAMSDSSSNVCTLWTDQSNLDPKWRIPRLLIVRD